MEITATDQGEVAAEDKEFLSPPQGVKNRATESYWTRLIPRRPVEIGLLALVVLVIFVHLQYLLYVSATVPHLDDWNSLEKMFRGLDIHRVSAFVFDSINGHFQVPAALGYLFSWHFLALDLTPLKLLNFPICLLAFLLTAHVINAEIRSRFLRFYLYLGAALIIFSLCLWEHFALASGFAALLSVLFGALSLYCLSKVAQGSSHWKRQLLAGTIFLLASVLSLGAGYAAIAAAVSLFALVGLKRLMLSRPAAPYKRALFYLAWAVGLLMLLSHPFFNLKNRIIQAFFHSALVMGSIGSASFDRNTVLAHNVAFVCGAMLIITSLWIGLHFLQRQTSENRLLPVFSLALVLFGLFGCLAVAVGRAYLPTGEFLNSRYTLYPSVGLLGTLLYFAGSRLFLLTNMWCFAAAAYVLATIREEQVGFYRPGVYRTMDAAIRNPDNLSDDQLRTALRWRENTKGARKVIARLRKDRLNLFHDDTQSNAPH
jgi:hypothetical protein